MTDPIQPIVPEGTPLPTPPVGVPPYPITPFAVWTWNTPVIPEFYWNIYSSEQRIKSICKEIGKIESYLNYLVNETNKNIIEIHDLIQKLTDRVAALEKKVEEEVARLDGLIAKLRADLEQEIADREAADDALGDRIDQEIVDRQHADGVLHEEIAQEVEDRIHGDDLLHEEISTETQDRIHADDQLHEEISHRLLPTDLQAGNEISITRPDPNSNTVVIASTVSHSLADLQSLVSGLQAALTSETAERRADDSKLWTAVNQRIERGKILAGAGIKVENDPDSSTVTISATGGGTGGGGGSTTIEAGEGIKVETEGETATVSLATPYPTVEGTSPVTVHATSSTTPGAGSTGTTYTVGVSPATESSAGIITEARVKELAGGSAPSLSAEAPLKLEDGKLSLTKDPAGPVTSSDAGLSVREITPDTSSESEAGVVSKGTIKSLATVSGGAAKKGGLKVYKTGGLGVSLGYEEGSSSGGDYNPLGVSPEGFLMLTGGSYKLKRGATVLELTAYRDEELENLFIMDASPTSDTGRAVFVLPTGYFEVRSGSGAWQQAEAGCFELFAEADRLSPYEGNKGYPISHRVFVRFTPRGRAFYTKDAEESGKTQITELRVTYAVYNLYILPNPA